MSVSKGSKSAERQARKTRKPANHEPLLRLVESTVTRIPTKARSIELKPLTKAQELYDKSINANAITFGVGPAGTGKTWWAAVRAAEELKAGRIHKIIITRPAVEAGKELGFLPGELEDKYEPYFRPVRDALEESLGSGPLEYYLKVGIIEPRPLNYLRGSTLKNCWVIADEMQNSTTTEMKLLLTRIGENAKFVINGDPSQCDLSKSVESGLSDAVRRCGKDGEIGVVMFDEDDIVRHGIIKRIIGYYNDGKASTCLFSNNEERAGLDRFLRNNE